MIKRRQSSDRRNKNPLEIKDPSPLINEMRLIKSKEEINLIQTAIDITEKGFLKAMQFTKHDKNEFEIQAVLEYEFRAGGSKRNGYPSIVASGKNACILHYVSNDKKLENNDQVLFRYCDQKGYVSPESNPNGSVSNIAGIVNETGNVLGMMPHPERCCDELIGGVDGKFVFESIISSIKR